MLEALPRVLFNVRLDGNKRDRHESADRPLPERDESEIEFNFKKNGSVYGECPMKVEPFVFEGVSPITSVFFLRLKVFFPESGCAVRWMDAELPASRLSFSNIEHSYVGSLRDQVLWTDKTVAPERTLSVSIGKNDKLVVRYTGTVRFDSDHGGAAGCVTFKSVTVKLADGATLARLVQARGDCVSLMLHNEDGWIGRANRVTGDEERRLYSWYNLPVAQATTPQDAATDTSNRSTVLKQLKFKAPASSRTRRDTMDSHDRYVPDGERYSNPIVRLPLHLSQAEVDIYLFNMRFTPARITTYTLNVELIRMKERARYHQESAQHKKETEANKGKAKKIFSPRRKKSPRAVPLPPATVRKGSVAWKHGMGMNFRVYYSVDTKGEGIDIERAELDADVINGSLFIASTRTE